MITIYFIYEHLNCRDEEINLIQFKTGFTKERKINITYFYTKVSHFKNVILNSYYLNEKNACYLQ